MGALGSNYQGGAVWIMTPAMFYENVMTITALNDYIINNGFEFKLFGHDVVLMSEALVSSKETILYGDPKAYKLNVFKALEVKPDVFEKWLLENCEVSEFPVFIGQRLRKITDAVDQAVI